MDAIRINQALLGPMRASAIRILKCLMPCVLLTTKTIELIGSTGWEPSKTPQHHGGSNVLFRLQ